VIEYCIAYIHWIAGRLFQMMDFRMPGNRLGEESHEDEESDG
jgi:hypothetical protein